MMRVLLIGVLRAWGNLGNDFRDYIHTRGWRGHAKRNSRAGVVRIEVKEVVALRADKVIGGAGPSPSDAHRLGKCVKSLKGMKFRDVGMKRKLIGTLIVS